MRSDTFCPLFLIAALAGMNMAAAEAAKTAPTDPESVYLGCQLYRHHCEQCHGMWGHGDGGAAYSLPKRPKNLANPDYWDDSDEDLLDVITSGRGAMPAYKRMLSEKQRLMVLAFVRTLAPKPEPKLARP